MNLALTFQNLRGIVPTRQDTQTQTDFTETAVLLLRDPGRGGPASLAGPRGMHGSGKEAEGALKAWAWGLQRGSVEEVLRPVSRCRVG